MEKVILYSTGCPRCKVLEKKLNASNISYEINSDLEIMAEKGIIEVPVMEYNGTLYSYKEAVDWINGGDKREL